MIVGMLGLTEVEDVDLAQLVVLLASDGVVAGLDVSVQVSDVVQVLQRFETLDSDGEAGAEREVLRSGGLKVWRMISDGWMDEMLDVDLPCGDRAERCPPWS